MISVRGAGGRGVRDRFHAVPLDLLKFLDSKVRRRGCLF
jgi:hypothetical protein